MAHRIEVGFKQTHRDAHGEKVRARVLSDLGIELEQVRTIDVFTLDMELSADELEQIASGPFSDPIIQTYRINDHPDYGKHLDLREDAAAIDIFIGDVDHVYKGLGAGIIRRFVKDFIFEQTDVVSCIIGPEPKNFAAIRAYEKAGFRYLKTVQVPDEPEPEYLMRLTRLEV